MRTRLAPRDLGATRDRRRVGSPPKPAERYLPIQLCARRSRREKQRLGNKKRAKTRRPTSKESPPADRKNNPYNMYIFCTAVLQTRLDEQGSRPNRRSNQTGLDTTVEETRWNFVTANILNLVSHILFGTW
jgi:hypothetical protein